MIPSDSVDISLTVTETPSKTFSVDFKSGRVNGECDNLEAVKQAVLIIVSTDRFKHEVLSWDFGIERQPLIGKSLNLAIPEIKRYITEALIQDDRISGVTGFNFELIKPGALHAQFNVESSKGSFNAETEVSI